MENPTASAVKSQFGASLDMLENAITACRDEHWNTDDKFWYISFHCIFWTDYYLSTDPDNFTPPAPFTCSEFTTPGKLPNTVFSKPELLSYTRYCKEKMNNLLREMHPDELNNRWINAYKNYSLLEILLYNLRHIQHHTGQLNLLLKQKTDTAPAWISQS